MSGLSGREALKFGFKNRVTKTAIDTIIDIANGNIFGVCW